MPIDLSNLNDPHGWLADPQALLDHVSAWQSAITPELDRRWLYHTDEPLQGGRVMVRGGENGRPLVTGQEIGLPYRISGLAALGSWWGVHPQVDPGDRLDLERKEVVTENEIGWRVRTFIDWCIGDTGPVIRSLARRPGLQSAIEELLNLVFEQQHRGSWLREWCTTAAVYGFADVHVRPDEDVVLDIDERTGNIVAARVAGAGRLLEGDFELFAQSMRWRIVDPREVVPLRDPRSADRLWGWMRSYRTPANPALDDRQMHLNALNPGGSGRAGATSAIPNAGRTTAGAAARRLPRPHPDEVHWIELHTPERTRVFRSATRDRRWVTVWDAANRVRGLPVVHKPHEPIRGRYDGCGIVEPLIPLQNELNIRLSDRAHKITMQAFKMYLGKGLENFADRVIGPGRMWHTDNPEASIAEFGGSTSDEGENLHIREVREAMDRVSAIPALAAGDIQGRIGNLTSATALQTVLRGLIGKVHAQREVDGRALAEIAERTLDLADALGVLPTRPEDRRCTIEWPEIRFVDTEDVDQPRRRASGTETSPAAGEATESAAAGSPPHRSARNGRAEN